MYPLETVLYFLACLDLFFFALLSLVLLRLPASGSKYGLIVLILVNICWQNMVICFRIEGLDLNIAALLSRFVIICGMLLGSALLLFVWHFTGGRGGYSRTFWLLQAAALLFIVLALLGFVEGGVRQVEYGLKPIYRALYYPFVLLVLSLAGYSVYLLIARYRQESNQLLRFQYIRPLWVGLLVVLANIVTNAILPILFQNSRYSFLGGIFPFFFFAELLRLLLGRERLFLRHLFRKVVRDKVWQEPENVSALMRLLDFLRHFVRRGPARFSQRLFFKDQSGKPLSLYLENASYLEAQKRTEENGKEDDGRLVTRAREQFLEGMADSLIKLDADNRRLTLALVATQQRLDLKLLEQGLRGSSKRELALPYSASLPPLSAEGKTLSPLEKSEREVIKYYLDIHRFNKLRTSQALGVHVNTLKAKIKKYKLEEKPYLEEPDKEEPAGR